jgi:small subunit ribosomal protein S9
MATKKDVKRIKKEEKKVCIATGKRKRAVARAVIRPGKGVIKINSRPLEIIKNRYIRFRIQEPLILAGDIVNKYDIEVNVRGGGIFGQADAVRAAISRALVEMEPDLKPIFLDFDRNLIVFDSRRTEPHKPSRSSRGPRAGKQQSYR